MKKMWRGFRKWFVPHEGNDHKPHILRPRTVAAVCAIAIAVEFLFLSGISLPELRQPFLGDIVVSALTQGTNQARVQDGLPPLQVSPLLTEVARDKVNDMVKNDYFAHTSPSGLSPWYWFEKVGYHFSYAGENLAVNFTDSQDVTNAWLNSPEHRANILSGNFTQIGIAVATGTFDGQPAVYVAEEFGTPALQSVTTSPLPAAPIAAAPSAPQRTVTQPKAEPTVVATSGTRTPLSEQTFVAVKGISTEATSVMNAGSAATASLPAAVSATSPVPQAAVSVNPVAQAMANPRAAVDGLYLAIALLFAAALILNVFVKVRVQHPNVILGGLIAVSVASMFIVLNQQFFTGTVIR